MARIHPAYLEHERKRFMRPNAYRFLRPDWRRFVRPGSELARHYAELEAKYRPDQPRVPAGQREGRQWADDGGSQVDSNERYGERIRVAGTVIRICIASGRGLTTDAWGNKSFVVTYECSGGRTFTVRGQGHSFPGIRIDPFQ